MHQIMALWKCSNVGTSQYLHYGTLTDYCIRKGCWVGEWHIHTHTSDIIV